MYVIESDGSGGQWMAAGDTPSWSPDGSSLVFTAPSDDGGTAVYVIDAAGGTGAFLAIGSNPSWSPDGSQIVFIAENS